MSKQLQIKTPITNTNHSTVLTVNQIEDNRNKITSFTGEPTDTQYPSALLTYDQLALKADKEGALPKYTVNTSDSVLNFITQNQIENVPIILKINNFTSPLFGRFMQAYDGRYSFGFSLIGFNDRFFGSAVVLENKTFADIFNATYREDFELATNKVTSLSSSSTDTQYPSAKATWDQLQDIRALANGKCNTFILDYTQTIAKVKTELTSYGTFNL